MLLMDNLLFVYLFCQLDTIQSHEEGGSLNGENVPIESACM